MRLPGAGKLAAAAVLASFAFEAEAWGAAHFSPRGNGRKQTVVQAEAKSGAGILRWEFRVATEADAKVVRVLTGEGAPPKEIAWDGMDTRGVPVADGKYLYILQVWDAAGNTNFSEEKSVTADSEAPTMALTAESLPDNVAVAALSGEDSGTGYASWRVDVQGPSGAAVRTFSGRGAPPKELLWDLRDDRGNAVAEGKYALVAVGEDGAGNTSPPARAEIDLSGRTAPALPLSFGVKSMSVGPDGQTVQNATFSLKATKASKLKAWVMEVRNEAGIVVRRFEGKGLPPPTLNWDGKSTDGQVVAGGVKCRYVLKVVPESAAGEKPLTVAVEAQLAQESAEVSKAVFKIKTVDREIERWILHVAEPSGRVVYRYEGKGVPPSQVTWDGRDDRGEQVRNAVFCRFLMRAYDAAGSVLTTTNPLSIATLTRVARHYVIPSVHFGFNQDSLRDEGKQRLSDAVEFLRQNTGSEVMIEGHTCNVGSRNYNLLLAHRRAQAVRGYLFQEKACRAAKVRVRALAFDQPAADNATEEGRELNRRAEVYISARVD